ncbi:MAG: hypothetical protein ABJP82_16225 [Hyphomicrobiales bacterium]
MLIPMDECSVEAFKQVDGNIQSLAKQAQAEGFSFIDRLLEYWGDGSNRFNGKGECFLQLMSAETLVAVGGINRDPYTAEPGVGRIRHLCATGVSLQRGRARAVACAARAGGAF